MPHPFERLLLATEHTEFDAGAERVALALARRCDQPLAAVLPVVSNPEYEAVAPALAARAEAQAAARLRELQAAAHAAGVVLHAQVRRGVEPFREIVDAASDLGSDLIVTRRRGRRGFLASLLVGEMVSQVVGHAPCSVLLVPRAGRMWSRRLLLALDPQGATAERQHLLHTALAVAAACALPLSLLCVLETDAPGLRTHADTVLAQALTAAGAAGVDADADVRSGKAYRQVVERAAARAADLIVVGRHGGGVAGRAWLGGTTQKVIGLADGPVLVVIAPGATA